MKKMEILEKIIELTKERNIEAKTLDKTYAIDGIMFPLDENTLKYFHAPRPKEKKLNEFLESLNSEELNFVATIMYGGRDYVYFEDAGDFKSLSEHLGKTKKGLIYSISEKMRLDAYLLAGIEGFKGSPEIFE